MRARRVRAGNRQLGVGGTGEMALPLLSLAAQACCSAAADAVSLGILNATASCAGVDSSGTTDSTAALQSCIERAYSARLALFLSPGRYLVSDTLTVAQGDTGPPFTAVNIVPCRFRANVLLGSTALLPARPTIVLKAGSPGFGNASSPKNVMKITNPHGEDINMNQIIRGIDFEVEPRNSGAIALFFHGAQGGVIQDVSVRLSTDSLAGFGGGGGAGTSHFDVAVHGGVHGAYFLESEPAPLLGNARLIGQSGSAIVFGGQGPLVVVGVHIVRPANASGAAIATPSSLPASAGQLSVVDTVVECRGSSEPALASAASVTVNGMWTSGCGTIVHQPGSRHPPVLASDAGSGWSVVHELARGIDTTSHSGDRLAMDVTYKNGQRLVGGTVLNISAAAAGPPGTVLSQHVLWDDATFPSFEQPTTVNAVEKCGVKGDGETDDEPALAACLKQYQDVFLPKGYYRLGKTLELNAEQRLVGLSQTHSVLMPATAGLMNATDNEPQPLVTTAAGSGATIAFLGINSWWHLPVFTLQWRSTGGLWRSNYETRVCECMWLANFRTPTTPCTKAISLNVPKTQVQGSGSFVNFVSDEDILMTDHVNYRHLHVSSVGTRANFSDRTRFYELNLEHSQAQANFEVSNSSHVDVFGIKLEGSTTIMWIRDSNDVNLFGLGGAGDSFPSDPSDWKGTFRNASYDFNVPADLPRYNASTVRVERTDKYKLTNLINADRGAENRPITQIHPLPLTPKLLSHFPWPAIDVPLIIASEWTPWPGWRVPPSLWSVAGEMDGVRDPSARLSTPIDRPVLFERG